MESLGKIVIGIIAGIVITVGVYFGIDSEMARRDYNQNVKQCKVIEGCLFEHNCNKYNKMILEECND